MKSLTWLLTNVQPCACAASCMLSSSGIRTVFSSIDASLEVTPAVWSPEGSLLQKLVLVLRATAGIAVRSTASGTWLADSAASPASSG